MQIVLKFYSDVARACVDAYVPQILGAVVALRLDDSKCVSPLELAKFVHK